MLQESQEVDEVPIIVIGMLKVFYYDIYTLIDLGVTLSFLTLFIAKELHVCPELLCEPYEVSTPIDELLLKKSIEIIPCSYCIKSYLVILLYLT